MTAESSRQELLEIIEDDRRRIQQLEKRNKDLEQQTQETPRKRRRTSSDIICLHFCGIDMRLQIQRRMYTVRNLRDEVKGGRILGMTNPNAQRYKVTSSSGVSIDDGMDIKQECPEKSGEIHVNLVMEDGFAFDTDDIIKGYASSITVFSANPDVPAKAVVKVPENVPVELMIPRLVYEGVPEGGVYKRVGKNIYFYVYYTSQPASRATATQYAVVDPTTFTERKPTPVPIIINSGSLVVNECIYDQSLTSYSPSQCQEFIRGGVLLPVDDLPELYINLSIFTQLKRCTDTGEYKVTLQGREEEEERKVLPYNPYFNSRPDIVIERIGGEHMTVVSQERERVGDEDEDNEEDTDGNTFMSVAEIKKETTTEMAKSQLLAEAFNVVITKFAQDIQRKRDIGSTRSLSKVSVYCVLLTDKGKKGKISKLTVDFDRKKCYILEDNTTYTCADCFKIVLSQ